MSGNTQPREIKFPEINWEKLGEGSIPKEEGEEKIRETIRFLIEVRALKRTNFLDKASLDEAREVNQNLEQLVEQFPQLKGVAQNLFGKVAKEMAEKNGDSKSLFGRLELLIEEAVYYGSLQEWAEEKLESFPRGLTESFLVRMRSGKDQFRYFLPSNWRSEMHKRTALVLRDLAIKAKNTWMAEKGIEPKSKPEPADTKDTTPKKRKTKKGKKAQLDQTPKDKAGKQAKVRKAEVRTEEDNEEINQARGGSVTSLSDIGSILPKK